MTFPGPNQTKTNERRRRLLPSEILFTHRPAELRANMTSAVAAGLRIDPVAHNRGVEDAEAGVFRVTDDELLGRVEQRFDVLGYLRGFLEVQRRKRKEP